MTAYCLYCDYISDFVYLLNLMATEEIGNGHYSGQTGGTVRCFTDRGREEIREVSFIYRPNLIAAIADLVERMNV